MGKETKAVEKKENGPPVFFKYMGLSIQLFTTIGLGTYIGWRVQQKSAMKFPLWILLFCFFSVIIAFYHLWISIKKDLK